MQQPSWAQLFWAQAFWALVRAAFLGAAFLAAAFPFPAGRTLAGALLRVPAFFAALDFFLAAMGQPPGRHAVKVPPVSLLFQG